MSRSRYLVSLGAGLLVGVVYGLLNVRSPAPPVVALVGLLGILAGEQIAPIAKRLASGQGLTPGWLRRNAASTSSARRRRQLPAIKVKNGATDDPDPPPNHLRRRCRGLLGPIRKRRRPSGRPPSPGQGARPMTADLILRSGRFTTLDPGDPTASAVAVKDGVFLSVGSEAEVMVHAAPTQGHRPARVVAHCQA